MAELPLLPFEKVLSYLSMRDRLKSRAVSRRWCQMVDSCKVKSLCFSEEPIDEVLYKNQLVCGAFAQNFISSPGFDGFFKIFGRSIFSHLKRLRLYSIDFQAGSQTAFTRTLNSFVHLEELDLIYKWTLRKDEKQIVLKLNLPMLKSVWFEEVSAIEKLTLNAPVLRKVKLTKCSLNLDLVHSESVESVLVEWFLSLVKVKNLKNLKQLYLGNCTRIDLPLLFGLEKLDAIHLLSDTNDVRELFEQKQKYGRSDLKIYRFGRLLDGPDDPVTNPPGSHQANFRYLAANPSRLADEIPFLYYIIYPDIWRLSPQSQATFLNRFTDLKEIVLDRKVQNVPRFLNFLKTFSQITRFIILVGQRQELFDRLPDFSVQYLNLIGKPFDFEFLFKLKNLIMLHIQFGVGTELILRALQKFEFLEVLSVSLNKLGEIYIETLKRSAKSSELFKVHIAGNCRLETHDLSAVIQFIEQNVRGEL